MTQCH